MESDVADGSIAGLREQQLTGSPIHETGPPESRHSPAAPSAAQPPRKPAAGSCRRADANVGFAASISSGPPAAVGRQRQFATARCSRSLRICPGRHLRHVNDRCHRALLSGVVLRATVYRCRPVARPRNCRRLLWVVCRRTRTAADRCSVFRLGAPTHPMGDRPVSLHCCPPQG
jgi:hypothetical protein